MNEEASVLHAAWMSDAAGDERERRAAIRVVLDADRAARARERRRRTGSLAAMVALVPPLLWAAAYGVTPLVRVAYALMAIGCAAGVSAEWLYLEWSRRALPGPDDMRSQLQRTAFLVECQVWLARTAVLWTAPIFVGLSLICLWLARERSAGAAVTLQTLGLAAWIAAVTFAGRMAAVLARQSQQLRDALADL